METEIDLTRTFSGLPAPVDYWHVVERRDDGIKWERIFGEKITVIESISIKGDGRRWLQVSVAKPSPKKMPTYQDLEVARKLFIGEDRECYQIFPPKARYINICPVLHLWCCLDAPDGALPHMEEINDDGVLSV